MPQWSRSLVMSTHSPAQTMLGGSHDSVSVPASLEELVPSPLDVEDDVSPESDEVSEASVVLALVLGSIVGSTVEAVPTDVEVPAGPLVDDEPVDDSASAGSSNAGFGWRQATSNPRLSHAHRVIRTAP